jgi:hypothetical protein
VQHQRTGELMWSFLRGVDLRVVRETVVHRRVRIGVQLNRTALTIGSGAFAFDGHLAWAHHADQRNWRLSEGRFVETSTTRSDRGLGQYVRARARHGVQRPEIARHHAFEELTVISEPSLTCDARTEVIERKVEPRLSQLSL